MVGQEGARRAVGVVSRMIEEGKVRRLACRYGCVGVIAWAAADVMTHLLCCCCYVLICNQNLY